MSLTRLEWLELRKDAKHIHTQSRLPDVRRAAKRIAMKAESVIGQVDDIPAELWKD